MRRLYSLLLLATLAASGPASAQDAPDLDGVFVGSAGDGQFFTGAISMFNPVDNAPPIAVTPLFRSSYSQAYDSLNGRPRTAGVSSFAPSMSASGRTAYLVDWFSGQGGTPFNMVAQDRDGSNRVIIADIGGINTTMDISPDGGTVLFLPRDGGNGLGGGRAVSDIIRSVPSDGSAPAGPLDLGTTDNCVTGVFDVTFSPDGSQIAFLSGVYDGSRPADDPCKAALYVADADGSNVQFLALLGGGDPEGDDSGTSPKWVAGDAGMDWKAGRIAYIKPNAPGEIYAPSVFIYEVGSGITVDTMIETQIGQGSTIQLSPDGEYVGYVVTGAPGPIYHNIEVRPVSGGPGHRFTGFPYGRRVSFDWADAPTLPAPDRLVFEPDGPGVLLWEGRSVALNPTLYATDGSVLSRTIHVYSGGSSLKLNQFTSELWGQTNNLYRGSICAQNAGITGCTTYNNLNTPILDAVVIDGDIAEDGRNPGVLRLFRYGRPDVVSIPVYEARPSGGTPSRHYLDYTLSQLPERLRWPASDALADTVQTMDIVLTPIDDGVAEAPIETGQLFFSCSGASGTIFGPDDENCVIGGFPINGVRYRVPGAEDGIAAGTSFAWNFEIASNGAGSGLAIASSSPAVIPASGQATLTVQGQGFAPGATATLSGPGSVTAVNVSPRFNGVQALARFELADLPPGSYDLTVTSDGQTDVLEDAVRVDAATPGGFTDVWATLQSNSGRLLLPTDQFIRYGNDGTADAGLTPMLIAVPEGYLPEFKDDLFKLPVSFDGYDTDASPWVTQTVRAGDIPGLCLEIRLVRSTARQTGVASSDARQTGSIDCQRAFSLGENEMLTYQVALVFLPTIPPGGRGKLTVSMTRQPDAQPSRPWFVRVGAPLNTLDFGDDEGAARLAAGLWGNGSRPVAPTYVSGCSPDAQARLALQSDVSTAAACAACLNLILGILLDASGVGACAQAAVSVAQGLYQTGIDAAAGADSYTLAADGAGTLANVAISAAECAARANPISGGLAAAYKIATGLSGAIACVDCFKGIVWGTVGEVYSRDPNDKRGPVGVGSEGYLAEFGRAAYTIRFENLATATASAVEVTVVDSLDTSVYDLSTFELGEVSLRDTTFTPPPGLQNWATTWDRRPAVNSVVRVLAELDVASGVVRWTLSDLDPTTYRLRTSAEAGFLPPNDGDGAGEGQMRFLIRAKPDLPDGTVIANGATIQFDREALITTPVWANTIDRNTPTSRVASATPFDADTSFVVRFEGTDPGAGVRGYSLYISADGGPFEYRAGAQADSVVFRGERGVTYRAFALATDWLGNAEPPKTDAELTFAVGGVASEEAASGPTELELAAPYPNPTRGAAVVQVGVPVAGPVRVAVYDVRGREVAVLVNGDRPAGWHPVRWDAGGLAAGVYVVRAQAGGRQVTQRLTVVR